METNILEGGMYTAYLTLEKKLQICVNCTEVANEVVYWQEWWLFG